MTRTEGPQGRNRVRNKEIMKKKYLAMCLIMICIVFTSACSKGRGTGEGGKEESSQILSSAAADTEEGSTEETLAETGPEETAGEESKADVSTGMSAGAEEPADTETGRADEESGVPDYPAEDAGNMTYESPLGYSIVYDPTVFTLDDTAGYDSFRYHTAESLEAPVYISVQVYTDMDAGTLADGLALQSGIDGVAAQDVYFGKDSLEAKGVFYERKNGDVTQTQAFYAVSGAEGTLLVEIGGYTGMPVNAEVRFEEMLGSFVLAE